MRCTGVANLKCRNDLLLASRQSALGAKINPGNEHVVIPESQCWKGGRQRFVIALPPSNHLMRKGGVRLHRHAAKPSNCPPFPGISLDPARVHRASASIVSCSIRSMAGQIQTTRGTNFPPAALAPPPPSTHPTSRCRRVLTTPNAGGRSGGFSAQSVWPTGCFQVVYASGHGRPALDPSGGWELEAVAGYSSGLMPIGPQCQNLFG